MPLTPFAFTPVQGYRDSSFAPTDPPSEAAFRDTMQDIPDQLRDEINELYGVLNSTSDNNSGLDNIGMTPIVGLTATTPQQAIEELSAKTPINIADDSVTNKKLAEDSKRVNDNLIINGNFDVWKRGVIQTTSGYRSDDRWGNENVGSTKTHSQQVFPIGQTSVSGNPKFFSRTIVSSVVGSANYVLKNQRIEDVAKIAGKTITISFFAKADSNKNLSIEFIQDTGSGGSLGVTGIGVEKYALTTSWQKFVKTVALPSVSGKIIGPNSFTDVVFWCDAGSNFDLRTNTLGHQSGTFDIARVKVEESSVETAWKTEILEEVERQCNRYLKTLKGKYRMAYRTTDLIGYANTEFRDMRTTSPTLSNFGVEGADYTVLTLLGASAGSGYTLAIVGGYIQSLKIAHGQTDTYLEIATDKIFLDAEL